MLGERLPLTWTPEKTLSSNMISTIEVFVESHFNEGHFCSQAARSKVKEGTEWRRKSRSSNRRRKVKENRIKRRKRRRNKEEEKQEEEEEELVVRGRARIICCAVRPPWQALIGRPIETEANFGEGGLLNRIQDGLGGERKLI